MPVKTGDRVGPENILCTKAKARKQGKNYLYEFKCPVCGKKFLALAANVKSGNTTKCKNCANEALKKN